MDGSVVPNTLEIRERELLRFGPSVLTQLDSTLRLLFLLVNEHTQTRPYLKFPYTLMNL